MYPFTYYNPVRLIFGENSIEKIKRYLPAQARILMVYGRGSIKQNGIYQRVSKVLQDFTYFEFSGIGANPEYQTLMQAVALVKEEKIDFLLAVGGGSVLDGTKFIAAAAKLQSELEPWDIAQRKLKIKEALPLASIMTIPATGSEMNCHAVISRQESREKLGISSGLLYPQFAVLEPSFTLSLPQHQKANGVVDAFVHVLEQYLTYPCEAPIPEQWAESVLRTLLQYGEAYVFDNYDEQISSHIMWACTTALNGMIATAVPQDWSTHAIGHSLTALFGLDHAASLSVVLPGVMQLMQDNKAEKILRMAKEVYKIPADTPDMIRVCIAQTEAFFKSLDMPLRLSDYNISESDIDRIVLNVLPSADTRLGERQDMDRDVISAILKSRL